MHKSLGVTWDWLPPPPILPQYTACTCIVYPICCSFLSNSGLITSRKRLSFSSVCVCVCGFFLQFGDKRKKLQFSPSMSRVTLYKLNWFYQCPVFPAGKKLNATVMKKMQQPKSRGKNPGHASEKRSLPLVLKTYPSFAWPGQRRSSLAQFLGQPLFDLGSLAWTEPSSSFFQVSVLVFQGLGSSPPLTPSQSFSSQRHHQILKLPCRCLLLFVTGVRGWKKGLQLEERQRISSGGTAPLQTEAGWHPPRKLWFLWIQEIKITVGWSAPLSSGELRPTGSPYNPMGASSWTTDCNQRVGLQSNLRETLCHNC